MGQTDKALTAWNHLRALPDDEWAGATVGLPPRKTSIHASLDRDVGEFFKRDGRGDRTRMNAVPRRTMEAQRARKADL